jgi:hypothetical protein
VPTNPAFEEFRRQLDALRRHRLLQPHIKRGTVHFDKLSLDDVAHLIRDDAAYYFLIAAAGLNRTSLKKAASDETAGIVQRRLRKAFAIRSKLPVRCSLDEVCNSAAVLRKGDLERRSKGTIEALFRERLRAEGIPLLMSPPIRHVPGLLIARRKPDGVYPDPSASRPPTLYLEIKNVRRVADDIQKRLYEIAEASLEMKLLYGNLQLEGLGLKSTRDVVEKTPALRAAIRQRIVAAPPAVVAVFLCPAVDAARYRAGGETFVDRIFFQEEIDECLEFLRQAIRRSP